MVQNIIVVGTSAGGFESITELLKQIPQNLPVSIFIVQHIPSTLSEYFVEVLQRRTNFKCIHPQPDQKFEEGCVYLAPPDRHMIITNDSIVLTKGPKENMVRPAIDPLFRSAAVAHTTRVTGIIMSGMLDDGIAGLEAVKRCGGTTIVQAPEDALYSEMPQNAITAVDPHFILPISSMGKTIVEICSRPLNGEVNVPDDIIKDVEISKRFLTGVNVVEQLGELTPYQCPECGGALWEIDAGHSRTMRCHVGHTYNNDSFLKAKTEKLEEALYISLRMLEERKKIFNSTYKVANEKGWMTLAHSQGDRVRSIEEQIANIREIIGTL